MAGSTDRKKVFRELMKEPDISKVVGLCSPALKADLTYIFITF
jgi:hypothetical protein